MKRLLFVLAVTALWWPVDAPAREALVARAHGSVMSPAGETIAEFTELTFDGDTDAIVTLWKGADGHRYILRYAEDNLRKETAISFSDLDTKEYLKVTWALPVSGTTAHEVKASKRALTKENYNVENVTVRTKTLTLPVPFGPTAQRDLTATLRTTLPPSFIKVLVDVAVLASGTGSPAARPACDVLASLFVAPASCRARAQQSVVPADDNCEFDAAFGYPCAQE